MPLGSTGKECLTVLALRRVCRARLQTAPRSRGAAMIIPVEEALKIRNHSPECRR